MKIGILQEPNWENRVSIVPETVSALLKQGFEVFLEKDAGDRAYIPDSEYISAGAKVLGQTELLKDSDMVVCIHLPEDSILSQLADGKTLLGQLQPLYQTERFKHSQGKKVNLLSMDTIPRITRAQSMDVLSSQASVAGYKAVLIASTLYSKFFPMLTTAAGTITPAKVLVLGAGVAGLQAIATARRLGAVVDVFDTRPEVKEQVMSLGGKFIEIEGAADASSAGGYAVEQSEEYKTRQKEAIHKFASKADIIITTALIPGRKAPVLITKPMLDDMKPGSVVIDLASVMGGNCEATEDGKTIEYKGIKILGNSNLPSTMPMDASKMYSKNVLNFLKLLAPKGEIVWNMEDEIIKGVTIMKDGTVVHAGLKSLLG